MIVSARRKAPLQNSLGVTKASYQMPKLNFKELPKLEFCLLALPTCLTTVERLEAKVCSIWPPNFSTITNSPVGYAFSGPSECLPSASCYSFYIHDYSHLLLYVTKPYQSISFSDQRLAY